MHPGSGHAGRRWPTRAVHWSFLEGAVWQSRRVCHGHRSGMVDSGRLRRPGFRESRCLRRPAIITVGAMIARRARTLEQAWANHPEQAAWGKPGPPAPALTPTGGPDQSIRRGNNAGEESTTCDPGCPALVGGRRPEMTEIPGLPRLCRPSLLCPDPPELIPRRLIRRNPPDQRVPRAARSGMKLLRRSVASGVPASVRGFLMPP